MSSESATSSVSENFPSNENAPNRMLAASKKATVLVTGASGFIACHIVKQLLDDGYSVRGTVRNLKDPRKIGPLKNLTPNEENLHLVEADLFKSDCWDRVVDGCDYVLHTASPFPPSVPKDADELVKPAVEGTLFVLRACAGCPRVKRVVLTGSVVSMMGDLSKSEYDESDWTDVGKLDSRILAYNVSKTLAERAAWDFMKEQPTFELAVVNPGFVMGPLLHNCECTSAEIVKRLLNREMPMITKLSLPMVDVRDVAKAHIQAMIVPEAAENRHILVNKTIWVRDLSDVLSAEFGPQGYWVPSMIAPYCLVWVSSFFDKGLQLILHLNGKFSTFNNSRMRKVLGVEPIGYKDTILDMAYSLIERGFVRRTAGYKPRKTSSQQNFYS